jgi:sigma-B regulation protein RsbU (phosphoserine phosphatase)
MSDNLASIVSTLPLTQALLDLTEPANPSPSIDELVAPVERQIEQLQAEIDELKTEVNVLRRRDETLKFYMQRVDEEMRLAARLQQDFLPKTLPQLGRVHFHTVFRPAGYVSGDLYDVMRLDEKHVGFYMADAVGHGMPAALLTMFIKNALVTKQIIPEGYRLLNPGQTMARLNDVLVGQKLSHATFATAIYGFINTETLAVSFARGGHPCPLLMRADGTIESLESDGSLLGIFENEQFSDGAAQLSSGDRLFVFSDGVEVAFGDGEALSPAQWRDELHRRRDMRTEDLLADFCGKLDSENGSIHPKDDLTMIVLEVK